MREKILFNQDWRFHEGDIEVARTTNKNTAYAQSKTTRKSFGPASDSCRDDESAWTSEPGWETVCLPHDYIIHQVPQRHQSETHGFFENKNAWYRKHFKLDEADQDKRITLFFEGVATHATVYVNGSLMKHNFCGYTSFEVDITDVVRYDRENVLAVYVNTDEYEGWWYQGGGIYRNVWLCKTDRLCLDLYGIYAKPVKRDEHTWDVLFETTVRNELYAGRPKRLTAVSELLDANGRTVAVASASVIVAPKDKGVIHSKITVTDPALWDIDSPVLYTVKTTVKNGEKVCDADSVRIGFRTAYCDPDKGFFLNGRHVKIKGVCAHQDFGLTGLAVPDNILHYKVQMIKDMGANGYRCSHYPHPAATMDALDEVGMIVMDETRWFESSDEGLAQLEMVMKRDRNRPSVFFWSLGNEEPHHCTDVGRRINATMYAFARKLDDQRFLMSAVDHPLEATVYANQDVIGINYQTQSYDEIHKRYPNKPIFASECSANSTSRAHYYDDDTAAQGYYAAYDHNYTIGFAGREFTWQFMMEREWVMGAYQWIAFEHRGETRWPRLCSQSGAIDMFLQKKDAFYQNLSHWGDKPMVHLMPHWNWKGMEGRSIRVLAYTNCDTLELFLNGASLGRKAIEPYGHGEWMVKYEPGTLRVVGYQKGQEVAHDEQVTTGEPVAIRLRCDNDNVHKLGDMALVTCYAVDANGREVPDATDFVHFFTGSGCTVAGTGSDVCDHVPPYVPNRKMRGGRISVAVKVTKEEQKTVEVFAEAERLGKTYLTIDL